MLIRFELMAVALVFAMTSVVRAAPIAYVANELSDSVSVINTETNQEEMVGVGLRPTNGVAVTPDGARVYVPNRTFTTANPSTVSVIDTTIEPNDEIATVLVGRGATEVAVTPDGTRAYVANGTSNTISVIDTETNQVMETIPNVANRPEGIAITPDGGRAFVAMRNSNTVKVIDTTPGSATFNEVIDTIPVGGLPIDVAITPDGTRAYVTNSAAFSGSNAVSVINTATHAVVDAVSSPFLRIPRGIVFTPDGTRAYVASFLAGTNNAVAEIDTATNEVVDTVPGIGPQPFHLAITPDGARLYVTGGAADEVYVVDSDSNMIVETVPVGAKPVGVDISGLFDFDSDGIHNNVDDDRLVASTLFSDLAIGGTTSGSVSFIPPAATDLAVTVRTSAMPGALRFSASGNPATLGIASTPCGSLLLTDGDVVSSFACGSLTAEVEIGPVEIRVANVLLTLPSGAAVAVTDLPSGEIDIQNDSPAGTAPIQVEIGGQIVELEPGEAATVSLSAHVDIKPGSCPNPLTTGVLPVAILGSGNFDVSEIDVSSLVLSRADGVGGTVSPLLGPPGPGTTLADVGTPFEGETCDCHALAGDGTLDLALKFRTPEVVSALALGELMPGSSSELVVSGMFVDGTAFAATDCISLAIPRRCGLGFELAFLLLPLMWLLGSRRRGRS